MLLGATYFETVWDGVGPQVKSLVDTGYLTKSFSMTHLLNLGQRHFLSR